MTLPVRSLLLVLLAAPVMAAESRAERGERIVQEALAALGGPRFLAMKDRSEFGRAYSFHRERLSGLARTKVYTRYLTRPEPPVLGFIGLRFRQVLGKNDDTASVFLEDGVGWDISYRGAKPIAAADVKRFQENQLRNVLYLLRMRMGERGLIFESQGTAVVDNQPVEMVDITDAENRIISVAFSQSSKLPVRQSTRRRTDGFVDEDVTVFNKYRDVDGVQWPFTIHRERNGEKIFELFSDTVEINKGLDDSLFTISGDTKLLKRK
jgi:hypothetical protein